MSDILAAAERLYDAINGHDARAIRAALHPEFVGIASDGMPCGVGGRHDGPDAMLRDCWGVIFAAFDIAVEVSDRLVTGPDGLVFVGRYVGTERATGRVVDAAFAHVLRVDGDRVSELRQITDTARWGVAPTP
jgi:ketosteroid isomerase-like protein